MEYKNCKIDPTRIRQQNDTWYYEVNILISTGPDELTKKLLGECDCDSKQEAIEHAENTGIAWIDNNL